VRDACGASIVGHAATLTADLAEAIASRDPDASSASVAAQASSLARYTQTVLQGAFVVAKATDDPTVVLDSIAHLQRYLELLFDHPHQPTGANP